MAQWRSWQLFLLIIFMTLLASGLVLLVSTQPRGTPIELEPIPSAAPIIVSVVGAVHTPGVYPLPQGSRVQHAVESAGGLTSNADIEQINLAGLLRDGQQVFVPEMNMPTTPIAPAERQGLLDLNRASLEELMTLPGIGEARARDIIAFRQSQGGFTNVEELMNIKGIGQSLFEKLKPLVTIIK
jgi:competence protein ComEA